MTSFWTLWFAAALGLRNAAVGIYQQILPPEQANLFSGIVLGNLGLDREFKNKLAAAGLTHVVAASGMNVSILAGMIFLVLSFLRIPKILKVILGLVLIGFYSTMTGFAPPIVRAGLMFSFSLVAGLTGRESTGFTGLLLSALLMLSVSPELMTDPSFLLSFTSMAGQIFLSTIKINLPKIPALIIGNFLQSFLALLFTAPIIVLFFARFSLVAMVTNFLVLWTVELLMLLGFVEIGLGIFFTEAARFIALPVSLLLGYFLWVVNLFSRPSWSVIRFSLNPGWPTALFITGYYLTLGGLIWAWYNKSCKTQNYLLDK